MNNAPGREREYRVSGFKRHVANIVAFDHGLAIAV